MKTTWNRHDTTGSVRGFTLVELLVVISIIAILMSLLLPSLTKAKQAARTITCATAMRQMDTAIFQFAGDHNGRAPGRAYDNTNFRSWHDILNVMVFGSKKGFGEEGPIQRFRDTKPQTKPLTCSNIGGEYSAFARVFAMNPRALGGRNWAAVGYDPYNGQPGKYGAFDHNSTYSPMTVGERLDNFPSPGRNFMINEGGGSVDFFDSSRGNPTTATIDYPYTTEGRTYWCFRHPDVTMNIAFVDGHVRNMTNMEIGNVDERIGW